VSRRLSIVKGIAAFTAAGLGGWAGYQLLRQNGRLLMRLEEVEARLGIGAVPTWVRDPVVLDLVQPERASNAPAVDGGAPPGLRLNLGCGGEVISGWLNHDRTMRPGVDLAWDLRERPWPLDDDSCERILARDVLEHLADVVGFMDECWRLLKPGGTLVVQAVLAQTQNQWIDPTHVRGFVPASFEYFDPTYDYGLRYGRWYTERGWQLILSEIGGTNVVAVLRPRKGPTEP
jgi:hypothetical protein